MRPCDDYAPKSHAFQAGYQAFDEGLDRYTCPYPDDDEQADEWLAGWDQASEVDYERRNHIGGAL